jgi:hypothetical protein
MKDKEPGVFKRFAGAFAPARDKGVAMVWRPASGSYPRLMHFESRELAGSAGLYLLWHLGVRPQWLRAGYSADLGAAVRLFAATPEIVNFALHDGPFLSWSLCAPEGASGLVNFLVERLKPVLQHQALACDLAIDPAAAAVPCPLPAGTKNIAWH